MKTLNSWMEENLTHEEIATLKTEVEREARAVLRAQELATTFVAELMAENNLGFNELVRKTGMSRSHLASILKGRSSPSLATLAKIAAACGKTIDIGKH